MPYQWASNTTMLPHAACPAVQRGRARSRTRHEGTPASGVQG